MTKKIFCIGVLAALTSISLAQGFGGGGQGRMRMNFLSGAQTSSIATLQLLQREDVKEELQITDEQRGKLDEIRTGIQTRMRSLFQGMMGQPPEEIDQEAMKKSFGRIIDEIVNDARKVLNSDQQKRLRELGIQANGVTSIMQPDVVKELNLTDAQKAKIEELQRTQQTATGGLFEKFQNAEINGDELRELMQKNQNTLNDLIMKALTATQKEKYKTLSGKPFAFKDPKPGTMPWGRPPGGGR